MNSKLIHFLTPGLSTETGGIQTYSRFLLKALTELRPESQIRAYVKNDRTGDLSTNGSNVKYRTCGETSQALRTADFAVTTLSDSLFRAPELSISTHIHFAPVLYFASAITHRPYWLVAHGVEAWRNERRFLEQSLRRASRILSVSRYTAEKLATVFGVPEHVITILPNAVDENRFVPGVKPEYLLKRYGIGPNTPTILTVSRLDSREQYKGYDRILESLTELQQTLPDVHYIVAGRGDDEERVRYLIRKLGLEKSVTLAGFVPDAELCDHYNLCDVFAMPSTGEGFGIVFLEALACGKPVLAGNRDGSVDAVLDGEIGALVDPADGTDLSHTLQALLSRTHSNQALFDPGFLREQVVSNFGFTKFKEQVRMLLEGNEK